MKKVLDSIIHKLLFTCEQATFLIEKKASAESIGCIDNIRLKGHIAMCKWCRAYNKKVSLMDNAMARISEKPNESTDESELKDFENQLIEKTLSIN